MKVWTYVDLGRKEIEVEIDGQDAVHAIIGAAESETSVQLVQQMIGRFYGVLRKLPDGVVAEMSNEARALIVKGLEEQVDRFRPGGLFEAGKYVPMPKERER